VKLKVILQKDNFDRVFNFIKIGKIDKAITGLILFDNTNPRLPYDNYVDVVIKKGRLEKVI
jgi:hypothetical protein